MGRVKPVIGGESIRSLYNGLILPHLQYCLMVWGDFEGGRKKTVGATLLRHQKKLVGMVAGERGKYHADPLLARYGILKIGDLYKQQLRVHAWQFWNDRLPENQAALFQETSETHNTRAARTGISRNTLDQGSIGFRVPKEWSSLSEEVQNIKSLAAFKRRSKTQFIQHYKNYKCPQVGCVVCGDGVTGLEGGGVNSSSQSGRRESVRGALLLS